MKSLNGLVFIVLGALAIWVGATGRLPALAAALGMVRASPGTGNKTSPTSAPKTDAQSGAIGLTPKGSAYLSDLQKELAAPWSQTWLGAMKDAGMVQ